MTNNSSICVGLGRGSDEMLDTLTAYYEFSEDAFRDLQKRLDQEISLLLVGDGEDDALLKKKCERESIQNVILEGFH